MSGEENKRGMFPRGRFVSRSFDHVACLAFYELKAFAFSLWTVWVSGPDRPRKNLRVVFFV